MGAKSSVVAVIPTFRPSEEFLELVNIAARSVSVLVVTDDASPCTSDWVLRKAASTNGVELIRHRWNAGIARGLNNGLGVARRSHAKWLLTLDQDSMVSDSYVDALLDVAIMRSGAGENLGALGAEVIEDLGGPMRYPTTLLGGFPCTEEVIQTGTLWNIAALEEVGGFDESLGMDAVDAGACLALRRAGYTIGVATNLALAHRIGTSRHVTFVGRSVMVTGHSPERRSSMVRNRLRLFPAEFAQSPRHALRTIRRVSVNQTLGLVVESQRWEKAKGSVRGLLPSRHR